MRGKMIICSDCKKELICIKTGMSVRYNIDGSHVYAGDLFKCPSCGVEIANTNNNPHYDAKASLTKLPEDIWMDVE
jgi:hypothetical protein